MGDKTLKAVEALLGGVATFLVLGFLYSFYENNYVKPATGWENFGRGWIPVMSIMIFSFFITFFYYYLLTKNQTKLSVNNTIDQNSSKSILNDKKIQIILGLLIVYAYFYLLSYFSDTITSFIYTFGLVFFVPFIFTRNWIWLRKVIWAIALFSGGFLFLYILQS